MQIDVLNESELEFGGGGRHVDPRFGIAAYGPADLGLDGAPTTIRLGLVGPRDHLDGLRRWIDRCRQPIDAKDARYPHLFPAFPGCDAEVGLFTTLTFADRNCREVSPRALEKAASLPGELAVEAMVDAYMDELEAIAEDNRVDVIVVARPHTLDDVHLASTPKSENHDTSRRRGRGPAPVIANLHDLLKARALRLGKPLQIPRRSTWDESAPPPPRRSRQDEATEHGTCTSRSTTRPAEFRGGCDGRQPTWPPATSVSPSTAPRPPRPSTPQSPTSSTNAATASSFEAEQHTSAATTNNPIFSPPTPRTCFFVSAPEGWSRLIATRARCHSKEFDLDRLYAVQAADELARLPERFKFSLMPQGRRAWNLTCANRRIAEVPLAETIGRLPCIAR
ncbi:hypothetical protein [Micromonospora ureilytica]|uniref:hypothetical protein n=1 Tax=Micromonospora ureilytica TaxID=709868 RepID=UPI0040399AB8